jgi:sodium-dependent dicarboxylate transporter 2/3/5
MTQTRPVKKLGNTHSDKIGYRDSRRAAFRIMQPGKRHALRRFLLFILVTAAAVAVWTTVTATMPPEQRAVLFLFLLAVGLWITEAVPAFAVGLLIMGYLVFALGTPLIMTEPWDTSP